ncbi:SRPBCC domain-containing protein [Paenibacillus nanensis]|uniref:SRPBCC domain-containing protein n=1 Tax=Paenibacillus nanensis TaxID=393251 RepID=A0A3A1ULZ4_9BACL|nr:SRPBCC domain-containing protein [Paenibacillus nanensis]RIX48692.1 SRPBCC domain-containing protein [Paenibacillus nanensis]
MFLKKKKSASSPGPTPSGKRGLYMTRVFDAPRDELFELFTQGEHMKNWWGPRGYEMTILGQELAPGGFIHYKQQSPEGNVMWGKFTYREIEAPEKLVYANSFADETGKTVRAYFSKDWPLEIVNTVTFEQTEDGRTKLTLQGQPEDAKKAENRVFEALRDHLKQGFTETFDLLDEYIEKRKSQ